MEGTPHMQTIYYPVITMALSLALQFIQGGHSPAIVFVTSAILFGYLVYLEQTKAAQAKSLTEDVEELKKRVENLASSLAIKGGFR